MAALDLVDRAKWNQRATANWDRCVKQADTVFQSICPGQSGADSDQQAESEGDDEMGDNIFVNTGLMLSDESTQALLRAMAAEEQQSKTQPPVDSAPTPQPAAETPQPAAVPASDPQLYPDNPLSDDPLVKIITWIGRVAKRLLPLLLTAGITLAIARMVFVDTNSTYDAEALEYIPSEEFHNVP